MSAQALRCDLLWGLACGGEMPRQELLDTIDRVLGNVLEYVAQIGIGIQPIEPGSANQRVDRGRAPPARIGASEQIVLSAQRYRAQRPFGGMLSISMTPSSR